MSEPGKKPMLQITCSRCGEKNTLEASDPVHPHLFIADMRRQGWKVSDHSSDIQCPKCVFSS